MKYRGRDADTNGEVSLLQDYLNSKGLFAQGATGFYGLKTVDAVKKFQKSNGILASGTVGSLTKKIIYNDTCLDQKTANAGSVPVLKTEPSPSTLDSKKVSTSGFVAQNSQTSSDSLPDIKWGNDTYSLASKPDAKDKWRDKLNIKDLYTDSYLKVSFDSKKPFTDPSMYEKVDRISGSHDYKNKDDATFWGKNVTVQNDTLYTLSLNDYGTGTYRRIILDNKVLFESKGMEIFEKSMQVLVKAGHHDLEIEYMQGYSSDVTFAFMPTTDLKKIKNTKVEDVIPKNSSISYIGVINLQPGKVTVNLKNGFTSKYIILGANRDTDWHFKGDTSSVLGVYTSNGLTSNVNGFKDGVVSYGDGAIRNYNDNFPAVSSLDYQCRKLYLNNEEKMMCNTYVNADELLRLLKIHNYTLSSFTGGYEVKNLEAPGLTFSSNEDVKKYMDDLLQKAKEEANKVKSPTFLIASTTPR